MRVWFSTTVSREDASVTLVPESTSTTSRYHGFNEFRFGRIGIGLPKGSKHNPDAAKYVDDGIFFGTQIK